ncbi:MAG: DUF4179 domain-containing protein [Lachnospiraceae bacterium]|nr:DUF4179 domain-containing protein [Lachnospiraceae bacterium]
MRTDEERLSAMHKRVEQLEERNRNRKTWGITAAVVALSLAIIVFAAIGVDVGVGNSQTLTIGESMSASIFASSAAIGYVVIGILAFILGIGVAILCYRLRRSEKT